MEPAPKQKKTKKKFRGTSSSSVILIHSKKCPHTFRFVRFYIAHNNFLVKTAL